MTAAEFDAQLRRVLAICSMTTAEMAALIKRAQRLGRG